jgi:hypothetical protein
MDTMDSPMSPFTDGFLHVSRGWLCNDILFLIFYEFRRDVIAKSCYQWAANALQSNWRGCSKLRADSRLRVHSGESPQARFDAGMPELCVACGPINLACLASSVKGLLAGGSDVEVVDMHGNTPLIIASEHGHYDVVDMLLDHGANVNAAAARRRWKHRPLHCDRTRSQ